MDRKEATDRGAPRAASGTAPWIAVRAAHLVIDGESAVLNDTVAARLLGGDIEAQIRAHADELQTPDSRGLRSTVVLRSRFAEDSLMDAVEEGVEQYVLLGAGIDTFAYRVDAAAAPVGAQRLPGVHQRLRQHASPAPRGAWARGLRDRGVGACG